MCFIMLGIWKPFEAAGGSNRGKKVARTLIDYENSKTILVVKYSDTGWFRGKERFTFHFKKTYHHRGSILYNLVIFRFAIFLGRRGLG